MKFLKASANPLDDINAVAYANQPIENRMYKQGYEDYFEMLPTLTDSDKFLDIKIGQATAVMNSLASELKRDPWAGSLKPLDGRFNRTILAMESPVEKKEGGEIILARWGDGFSSPVHGHADGMLYEQLIFGKMRVNTYRIVDQTNRLVRPIETKIYNGFENIATSYTLTQAHMRSAMVHNFTSIGYSASLHYVPEHTRDGRGNGFAVQYFEDTFNLEYSQRLTAQQGIEQLRIGDVALVRSENVPEYGDHYIVITGKPILKEHGLRPAEIAIHAPHTATVLNQYEPIMGLTLLKLSPSAKAMFYLFHGIAIESGSGKVIFPNT